jgi:hypothetical protein
VQVPEPLTRPELERLWRWERHMVRFHMVAIPLLGVAVLGAFNYSEIVWLRRTVLGVVIVLVVAATVLQLSERCPRCRSRLRVRLFRLPARCHYCGVAFERPPEGGGS